MNGTHERVSGYTISTGFYGLMGDQWTPGFWGITPLTDLLHRDSFKLSKWSPSTSLLMLVREIW